MLFCVAFCSLFLFSQVFHGTMAFANENCSLLLFDVHRSSIWCLVSEFPFAIQHFLILLVACCSFLSILSQKPKQAFPFRCSLLPHVRHILGFGSCFHLMMALLVLVFSIRRYQKPQRAREGRKIPNGNLALVA